MIPLFQIKDLNFLKNCNTPAWIKFQWNRGLNDFEYFWPISKIWEGNLVYLSFTIQIPTEVLSHPVIGQEVSNNLSYGHSILFKIVSFESLNTVDYNHIICFEFIVIQAFLDSKNARDVRFCQDKSLVVCRMTRTKHRQTLV